MTGFTMKEEWFGKQIEYHIYKNGKHSGCISASVDGDTIIDDMTFTTAQELASAIINSQVAVMSRANEKAVTASAMASDYAQEFISRTTEYLRQLNKGK